MFKETEDATYSWPVTVYKPKSGSAGDFSKGTFTGEFRFLDQDEIDLVLENARMGRDNADLAAKALVGWGGDFVGADGHPVEYTDDNKALRLKKPYFRNAVVTAFVQSISGDGARRKN